MSQTKAQLLDPTGVFTLTDQLVAVGATFSGNVSIAGTLTKQDVTNVDSVGLITARSGIKVTGGNVELTQGAGTGYYQITQTSGNTVKFGIVSGSNIELSGTSNNDMYFKTNNTERLRITGAGKVGINSTSPTYALEVDGGTQNTVIVARSSDAKAAVCFMDNTSGGYGRATIGGEGDSVYITSGSGTERIRIGTGGNGVTIGINTNQNLVTGSEVLSVRGYSSFKSYNKDYAAIYTYSEGEGVGNRAAHVLFNWGGANRGGFGVETDNATLILNNQNPISFRTGATGLNGTERLRITTEGIETAGNQIGNAVAISGTAIDCSLGNYFTKTITGATAFTFSNVPASGKEYSLTIELTLNGSNAVTWPAAVKWPGDAAPAITDAKTQLFMLVTRDGGTKWRGSSLVDYTT